MKTVKIVMSEKREEDRFVPQRQISVRTLDDGRACIHWLRSNPEGNVTMPVSSHAGFAQYQHQLGLDKATIACNPEQNTVQPQIHGGIIFLCINTPSVGAVTCPDCMATKEYQESAAILAKHASQ